MVIMHFNYYMPIICEMFKMNVFIFIETPLLRKEHIKDILMSGLWLREKKSDKETLKSEWNLD